MQLPECAAQDRQHVNQGVGARVPLEADAGGGSLQRSPNWQSARGARPVYEPHPAPDTSRPDIVEAILDGRAGPEGTLVRVLEPFPAESMRQI